MRKEPFGLNSIVHIYNRGNRKQEIVRNDKDREHFLRMLFYFNDEYSPLNTFRTLKEILGPDFNKKLIWPNEWPERKHLVKILGFTLMENHYHLILQEHSEGGVAKFMKKFGVSMTGYFNTKYQERGKLFQGSYKARLVNDDNYLAYLSIYIQVKNVFELYPGGIKNALKEFDKAYDFACNYKYGSLSAYTDPSSEQNKILDKELLMNAFVNKKEYKKLSKSCLDFVFFEEKSAKISFDAPVEVKPQQD